MSSSSHRPAVPAARPAGAVGLGVGSSAERDYRWNAAWFTADYVLFGISMSFLHQSTVLPTFVSQLTDSPFLVGLVATVQSGAWLLPQLFAAGLVAGRPRKRPYMLGPAIVGRPAWLLLAGLAFAVGGEQPALLLVAFYLTMALFGICDGLVSVPWFDIFGKAIPAARRGRLMGTAQIVMGVAGVAVGGVVALLLAHPALPFPRNYAAIFALAGLVHLIDFGALAMIREPAESAPAERRSLGHFLAALWPTLRGDRRFARIVAIRLIFGIGNSVFPFYVVFARKELGFGPEQIGLFLSAQVLGGVLGGLLLGQLADRRDTQLAVRGGIAAAALGPALALTGYFGGAALGPALLYATAAIFVSVGVTFSGYMLGFTNYVLEIAPAGQRPTYVGLANTISGSLLLVPALAGWLVEATSYQAVFGLALALLVIAGLATLWLPRARGALRPAAGQPAA